ncbi:oxidoreductase [Solibacillus sp. R5-41]|uniref:aldo/keto reductase n=1 Tax=Solibacillus sp. R5-41 TaxID=2048654 RepID=UPI000C1292A0|nr:aldo/keto reductase [Solibacillus sp. R5-41]ATP39569.1 oxidoreductase [Solibacillus sp. R5-41]
MKKRILGTSPIEVSEISLGCMSLPPNKALAANVIAAALDYGINYFDTADLYDRGVNEEIVGALVKKNRHDIILATKGGNRWEEGKEGWHWDASPAYLKQAVKDSLRRLQTDYIDVYQLHGGTIDDNWEEIIDTFNQLKKEGLIREYGISSIRPNVFIPFLKDSAAISNMMQLNILDQRASEYFTSIQQSGASVVTRGSIAKGLLTNDWRNRLQSYMGYEKEHVHEIIKKIEHHYEDVHAAALAFNLQYETIASTVIGARTMEQLQQNLTAYQKAQQIDSISTLLEWIEPERYTEHR